MDYDLDRLRRELTDGLKWLLREVERLSTENERLLAENKQLREEVTLARLHDDLLGDADLPIDLVTARGPEHVLSPEALSFYRRLPDEISFLEFFRRAESERLSGERSRELILLYFQEGLLQQRGRRLEKRCAAATNAHRAPEHV